MDIAERIKELRKKAGLTQQQFADRLGVKRNTVAQWELNINAVTDQMVKSICREFNVNELWLREGIGDPFLVKSRAEEMGELVNNLMQDDEESFRVRLITALLRFDPKSKHWSALEEIYNAVAESKGNDTEN